MDQAENLLGLWLWRQHGGFQHTLMKEMPGYPWLSRAAGAHSKQVTKCGR